MTVAILLYFYSYRKGYSFAVRCCYKKMFLILISPVLFLRVLFYLNKIGFAIKRIKLNQEDERRIQIDCNR